MRSRVFAVLFCLFLGADSSGTLAQNDVARTRAEQQIVSLLHSRSFWTFPTERPQGPPDIETVFGDGGAAKGHLAVELTAKFEGCVLVTDFFRQIDKLRLVTKYDLTLIDSDPGAVTSRQRPQPTDRRTTSQTTVSFPFLPWVDDRLSQTRQQNDKILDEAYRLFPSDVPSRRIWLKEQEDRVLTDKTYLTAGGQTWITGEYADTNPGLFDTANFDLAPESAEAFTRSVHDYIHTYCPEHSQPPPHISGI